MHSQAGFPDPATRHRKLNRNVIVLIRNPAKAIPSWYNQIYETRVNAPFHSQQAPAKNWKRWSRTKYHQIEFRFKEWRDLILYWLESPFYTVDMFVPFEQMVNASTGPKLLGQVTTTLVRSKVSTVVDPTNADSIQCLWEDAVQNEAAMKRSSHKYTPSYTSDHQQNMLMLLDDFILQVSYRKDLESLLKGYRQEIENNLVIED